MTTMAPANLLTLAAYWRSQGGVNLGIVGDTSHVAGGTSYHLGKSDLQPGAYSAQTARDKAGLSNYASAIDLGKLDGSLPKLRQFSVWLVAQCRTNAADTRDVREVIYSPDGTTVLRWDRERGIGSPPRDGEADNSHRIHTHISYYRDSRGRDQTGPFRRYLQPTPTHTVHIAHNAIVRKYSLSSTGCIRKVTPNYGVDVRWTDPPSKAACHAPKHLDTCDGRSGAMTVYVPDGAFAGQTIKADSPGVTVTQP